MLTLAKEKKKEKTVAASDSNPDGIIKIIFIKMTFSYKLWFSNRIS